MAQTTYKASFQPLKVKQQPAGYIPIWKRDYSNKTQSAVKTERNLPGKVPLLPSKRQEEKSVPPKLKRETTEAKANDVKKTLPPKRPGEKRKDVKGTQRPEEELRKQGHHHHHPIITEAELKEIQKDDRVRKINKLIAGAEVENHLVAQMVEKKKIQEKQKAWNDRMDRMHVDDMKKAHISQLKAKEAKRMAERKCFQQDNKLLIKAKEKAKKQAVEQEKQEALKNNNWIKNKEAKQAKIVAAQRELQRQKEISKTLVSNQLKKIQKSQIDDEEARIRRHQEIKDREWRAKQKQTAEKKQNDKKLMQEAWREHTETKRRSKAAQCATQRKENKKELAEHQLATAKQQQEDKRRRQASLSHGALLKQQVDKQEAAKKRAHKEKQRDERQLLNMERTKSSRIDQHLKQKHKEFHSKKMAAPLQGNTKKGSGRL